jgi:hypothetical protein
VCLIPDLARRNVNIDMAKEGRKDGTDAENGEGSSRFGRG